MDRGYPFWSIKFLVREGGANVHSTASNGDTVLHLAITLYEERRCLDLVKTFVEAGCDPTAQARGRTALEFAIQYRYTSVVEFLLLSCGVPCPPDILPTALQHGSTLEMIELLVRKGADVHSNTTNGETVLHFVATRYCESTALKLVKIFIEAGCDPMRCNSGGKSAWMAIMEYGFGSVLELLSSSNIPCPPDVLLMALWYRLAPRTIHFLICNGANAKLTTVVGDTALHLIIAGYWERTCPQLVRMVVEAGCNPNSCDSKGKSALMAAIEKGYTSVVELLLSYSVSLPPDILLVALQFCASPTIIELLIRHGANVHFPALSASVQIAYTSYLELMRQLAVVDMVCTARCVKRAHASLEDGGIPDHVEKRPRLEGMG
ncbi:ankyrin repeat-containing domain protein [Chiua virens]|nr:ankyrin repeat-containing domain protein [Chiua virens]